MLLEKHVVSGRYSVCRWCGLRQSQCWEVGGEESDKLHLKKKKKTYFGSHLLSILRTTT